MALTRPEAPGRTSVTSGGDPHVIPLRLAPGSRETWDRPAAVVMLWSLAELLFVYNPWQPSSTLRARVLRAFGATIGTGVILRPRLRVRFPWKLEVGDDAWIGEGVWLHNQDRITIGHDAVISQDTFLTTGSHAHRRDMGLIVRPIVVEPGAWVTSRCIVLGGSRIGRSALVTPLTVVNGDVPDGVVFGSSPAAVRGQRFPEPPADGYAE